MTTHARPRPHSQGRKSARAGTVTLVLGLLLAAGVVFTFVLSLSEVDNAPNWVRAVGLMWLPIGFAGTRIAYALARTGRGRERARIGALLALPGLAAFVALVVAIG